MQSVPCVVCTCISVRGIVLHITLSYISATCRGLHSRATALQPLHSPLGYAPQPTMSPCTEMTHPLVSSHHVVQACHAHDRSCPASLGCLCRHSHLCTADRIALQELLPINTAKAKACTGTDYMLQPHLQCSMWARCCPAQSCSTKPIAAAAITCMPCDAGHRPHASLSHG